MFHSLTFIATRETYFASRKQENGFELSQKHFCFTDANFVPSLASPDKRAMVQLAVN